MLKVSRHFLAAAFVLTAPIVEARDSSSVGVGAYMPLQCRVDLLETRAIAGGALMTLKEFCNSSSGFRVWMDATGFDEGVRIFYDGQVVSKTNGRFLVIDAPFARNRQTEVEIRTAGSTLPPIRFNIEAISN